MNITENINIDKNYKVSYSFYNAMLNMLTHIQHCSFTDNQNFFEIVYKQFNSLENKVAYFYDLTINDWFLYQEIYDEFKLIKLKENPKEEFSDYLNNLIENKVNV